MNHRNLLPFLLLLLGIGVVQAQDTLYFYKNGAVIDKKSVTSFDSVAFKKPEPPLAIGQSYQGGKIAYILQPGDVGYDANVPHGFIAAPNDQSTSVYWGCYGKQMYKTNGEPLGRGMQNTIDIMKNCTTETMDFAAGLCANLVLGGYDDWYLPSLEESKKLCINRVAIGGFVENVLYWTSSDYTSGYAYALNFNQYLSQIASLKGNFLYVRAIRSF